jgi:hypothetical protein
MPTKPKTTPPNRVASAASGARLQRASITAAELERGKLTVQKAYVDEWVAPWVKRMQKRGYRVEACYSVPDNTIKVLVVGPGGHAYLEDDLQTFPSKRLMAQIMLVAG